MNYQQKVRNSTDWRKSSRKLKINYLEFFLEVTFLSKSFIIQRRRKKCKLKNHTEKLKTQLFEEEKTLEVPLNNASSRMLNVFEKDVLSKINDEY